MSWFARILQRGKKAGDERTVPGPTPPEQWTVAGLPFDTTGWQLGAATPSRMAWTAPAATMVLTRSEARGEALAATLTDLRNGERQEARARGEDIVAVDVLTTRGIEAFRAAYKRRSGSGHAYRGVVEVRGANACFRIESDIDEAGTTGTREAMVNAMRLKVGDMTFGPVSESGSRRILGHSHDPYDAAFDEDALLTVSDDERLDVLTPGHPIARTRSVFKAVIASLRISFDVVPGRILAAPAGREEQMPPRRLLSNADVRGLYTAMERYDLVEASLQEEIAKLGDTPSLQRELPDAVGRLLPYAGSSWECLAAPVACREAAR